MSGASPLTRDEDFVRRWLGEIGITATKVAEDPTSVTCDFRATDDSSLYWVEVKTRTGDQTVSAELREKGTAYRARTTGYYSTLAAILDEAKAQLQALSSAEPGFELVFLLCTHPAEARLAFDQAAATVFGSQDVIDLEDLAAGMKWCFFFGESSFFKHKSLDAVVSLDAPSGRFGMFVNPYSEKRFAFGESLLFRTFQRIAAERNVDVIIDPVEFERSGRAYWVDRAISRRDEEAVLQYLKEKYGLKRPKNIVLEDHSAYAVIEKNDGPKGSATPPDGARE